MISEKLGDGRSCKSSWAMRMCVDSVGLVYVRASGTVDGNPCLRPNANAGVAPREALPFSSWSSSSSNSHQSQTARNIKGGRIGAGREDK